MPLGFDPFAGSACEVHAEICFDPFAWSLPGSGMAFTSHCGKRLARYGSGCFAGGGWLGLTHRSFAPLGLS